MRIIEIDSAQAPEITDYTRLNDMQLRQRIEPERGLFMAEGATVIERAHRAGHTIVSVLTEDRWLPRIEPLLAEADVPVYVAQAEVLEAIVGYRLHRGALAVVQRPQPKPVAELIESARTVVVIEDLVDHTNVGLIFRNAAALGVDAVLVSPRCADPWYRRSVKSSMGTIFSIPWTIADPWPWMLDDLGEHGFTRYALTPAPDADDLGEVYRHKDERIALLFGTEGPGLSQAALQRVDRRVRIPMHRGVDSLNVAAAAAVACFALASTT